MISLLQRFKQNLVEVLDYKGISTKAAGFMLLGILLLTAAIRLATIQSPALDRTSWKEIDHIMISENYAKNGRHFLKPEVSWPADEPRVTAMELPVVPYIASFLYTVFGMNVFTVRILTLLAYVLLVFYMFKLVKREMGTVLALLTALFTGLLPMFNPYRNYLFSEPFVLLFSVFAIYHYAEWIEFRKKPDLVWFMVGFALTVSLKPTSLYIGLPLLWIHFRAYRFDITKYWSFIWPIAIAMVVPVLWYIHAYYLSQNYIDVFGVFGGQFGGHDKLQTFMELSSVDWYKTMFWRLQMNLLGKPGLLLIVIGALSSLFVGRGKLFLAYFIAILCFFAIVAEGNIDTHYRQLTIIPPGSFLIALGALGLSVLIYSVASILGAGFKPLARAVAVVVPVVFLLYFPVRNPDLWMPAPKEAPVHGDNWFLAQEIKKFASDNSKIIMAGEYTIHKGGNDVSPVTYYYSGLKGWTIQEGEWNQAVVDSLMNRGADLLGATAYKREPGLEAFLQSLTSRYEVLYDDPERQLLLLSLKPGLNKK